MLVSPDDAPDVVALIPTLGRDNGRLSECVSALALQQTTLRLAIVCLANTPRAGSVSDLPDEVRVVEVGLNLGWGAALTFGRGLVEAPYLWLVQDDMVADSRCLEALHRTLVAEPTTALVSPVAVDERGLAPASSCGGFLDDQGFLTAWYPEIPTAPGELDRLGALSYVASRGTLVRTEAWDAVGGTDPRFYPVMFADVDLCTAVRRSGWSIAMEPAAKVRHGQRGSTVFAFASFLAGRNAELFAAKWFPDSSPDRPLLPTPPPRRPTPPGSITGTLHPALPSGLVQTVAQASADALLHLGSHHGHVVADHDRQRQEYDAELIAVREHLATFEAVLRRTEDELAATQADRDQIRRALKRTRGRLRHARSWRGRLGLSPRQR